jgi:hypothetical protein
VEIVALGEDDLADVSFVDVSFHHFKQRVPAQDEPDAIVWTPASHGGPASAGASIVSDSGFSTIMPAGGRLVMTVPVRRAA